MHLSPDGKMLMVQSERMELIFFDVATGKRLHVESFRGQTKADPDESRTLVRFHPTRKVLLVAWTKNFPVIELDLLTWQSKPILDPGKGFAIHLAENGQSVALAEVDEKAKRQTISIYALDQKRYVDRFWIPAYPQRGQVHPMAIARDGTAHALVCWKESGRGFGVRLSDSKTGQVVSTETWLETPKQLSFSADQNELFYLTEKNLRRFSIERTQDRVSLRPIVTYNQPWKESANAEVFRISPDQRYLLMSGADGMVAIFELKSNRLVANWQTNSYGVNEILFTPDGKTVITSSSYESIPRFWDYETATDRARKRGHRDRVMHMKFTPDGKHLLSASDDGSVRVWNLEPRKIPISKDQFELRYLDVESRVLCETIATFQGLWLTADGKKAVAWKMDEGLFAWDWTRPTKGYRCLAERPNAIHEQEMSPCGSFLATVEDPKKIRILSLIPGKPVPLHLPTEVDYEGIRFLPDGKTLFAITCDSKAEYWDVKEGKKLAAPPSTIWNQTGHDRFHVCYSDIQNRLQVWNMASGRMIRSYEENDGDQIRSSDGRYMIRDSNRGRELIEILTGARVLLDHPRFPGTAPTGYCFSPNGQILAIGFRNGLIDLYDLRPPRPKSPPTEREMSNAWEQLLSKEFAEVRKAIGLLSSHPDRTLPFLAKRVVYPKAVDLKPVEKLLEKLQHHRFATRELAYRELEKMGDRLFPRLEAALRESTSTDFSDRLDKLLTQISQIPLDKERLRLYRLVEILERIENQDAKTQLRRMIALDDLFLQNVARETLHRINLRQPEDKPD
jgi:WD40 repeat protein